MHVLFVCGGNTCRSPMAEAIMRRMVEDQGLGWTVESAGVRAEMNTAPPAVRALRLRGLEPAARPTQLTEPMVGDASVVFCMTDRQRSIIVDAVPANAAKIHTWAAFLADEIGTCFQPSGLTIPAHGADDVMYDLADPIGQPDEVYERTAATIEYLAAMTIEVLRVDGLPA